jgi:hypothetical protein
MTIPHYSEILPHIPEQGIEEFELSANLQISLPHLRSCLSKCPTLKLLESYSIWRNDKGHNKTVINRIWIKV